MNTNQTISVFSPRPAVAAFASEMEAKLCENDHKGGREEWRTRDPLVLLAYLKIEVAELELELRAPTREPRLIAREAADVGNIAMMVADACGALAGERVSARSRKYDGGLSAHRE